jgi:NAD(P)-dependent dehydrogenase (short-subunit alcohol dehydrogenase family)
MKSSKGFVLITGAAKRLGRDIALELAAAGWDIALHFHSSRAAAESAADAIRALGRSAHLAQADLADSAAVQALIPSLNAEIGPLAALVNNASIFERDESDPGGLLHRAINLEAPLELCEQFYRQRQPDRVSVIVNMLESTVIPARFSAYEASKKALRAATLAMANRMAPFVRVNGIAPGPTLISARETPAHFARQIAATPLQTSIPAKAITSGVLFLIENEAMTGAVIPIDGGMHLRGEAR